MTEGVCHFYVSGQGIFNKSTKGNKDTHTPWATYLWQGRQRRERRGLDLNTYYSGARVQIWYLWLVLYSDKKLLRCRMYFSPPLDRCYNVWKSGPECIFLMKQNFICISEIEMFEAWHPFIHSERLDLITIGNEPFSISIPCFSCFIEYQSYLNQVPTYQWLWVPILIVTILEIWDP
jgi:hypothetical protein